MQNLIDLTCEQKNDITCKQLSDKYNAKEENKYKTNPKKIGSIVRNDFKLKTERITSGENKGQTRIILHTEKIKSLCLRFNIEIPEELHYLHQVHRKIKLRVKIVNIVRDFTDNEKEVDRNESQRFDSSFPLLNDDELTHQEKEIRNKLPTFEKSSQEYANVYSQWFALRDEGEKEVFGNLSPLQTSKYMEKKQLSKKSAIRLQTILSKRMGRKLSDSELVEAYNNLMGFAYALVDLVPYEENLNIKESLDISHPNAVSS